MYTKTKTELSADIGSPNNNGPSFEVGEYYSIKVVEPDEWKTGGKFVLNWLVDDNSETLQPTGSGSRTLYTKKTISLTLIMYWKMV